VIEFGPGFGLLGEGESSLARLSFFLIKTYGLNRFLTPFDDRDHTGILSIYG